MRLIKGLIAIIALAVIVLGPPWALIHFIGNPWPAEGISAGAPLTDSAVLGLIAVLVWVLWAQMAVCLVVEAVAAISKDRIQLPAPFTLGVQQNLARMLITWAMLAIVISPLTHGTAAAVEPSQAPATTAAASATTGVPAADLAVSNAGTHDRAPGHAAAIPRHHSTRPARTTVTAKRLDSLWSIAEQHLGDGSRWPEIAALNEGRTMNDGTVFTSANTIKPGWDLLIPTTDTKDTTSATTAAHPDTVAVKPGDTLSGITEHQLGEADRWPQVYQLNRDAVGPDPNLIYPGEVIELPTARTGGHEPGPREHTQQGRTVAPDNDDSTNRAQRPFPPVQPSAPAETTPPATVPVPTTAPTREATGRATETAQSHEDSGVSGLRVLLASVSCLSAGALVLLAANRRRQFRHRRPGRTIASTPPESVEVEQAIVEHGSEAHKDVEFIDRALRHAAASCRVAKFPLPQLGAVVLGEDALTLLFTAAAEGPAPEGWSATDDQRAWMLARETYLEDALLAQPAPYPAVVSIGQDDGGRLWLLDLETLGVVGIAGDHGKVADLTRYLVTELAVNAWSENTEVLVAGDFADETIRLNPYRVRHVEREDALRRAAALITSTSEGEENLGTDVLDRRRDGELLDSTGPVVITMPGRVNGPTVDAIEGRDRSRVVLVHEDPDDPAVQLRADGSAFLPRWGITLTPFLMSADQVGSVADLIASTRNLADQPVPVMADEAGPLGRFANADGSLREEFVAPRLTQGGDPSSLLPEADEVYLEKAATTADDLAAVAPSVPEETRAQLEAIDPTLEQDLAAWFDEASSRPKVRLLGRPNVTALAGADPASIPNIGGTISFIAYLVCQDKGVPGDRAAEAFGWKTTATVQNRARDARKLLGTREDGTAWLPDADATESAKRGLPTYEIDRERGSGVLVDIDLFVRLRFRAHKRGETGWQDLVTALSLVEGEPFEDVTDRVWRWLPKGQRHDVIIGNAIEDSAHVVATKGVTEGRADLVQVACQAARRARPHNDIAWLDMAAQVEAEDGPEAADELVRENVLDRVDEDLPPRTEAVLDRRRWAAS